jgi:hypothetical protein
MKFELIRARKKTWQVPAGPARVCLIRAGAASWIQNREFWEEILHWNLFPAYRPYE